jgi:hypothetical protein
MNMLYVVPDMQGNPETMKIRSQVSMVTDSGIYGNEIQNPGGVGIRNPQKKGTVTHGASQMISELVVL